MKNLKLHEKMEFENVRELIERTAEMYSDRYAYSFREKPHDKEAVKISFPELRDDVRALASEMISRGMAGKRCVVVGKFSYTWAKMYFSILSIGSVIVPLDRDWLAPDLADTAKRADADFLFIDGDLKDKADAIVEAAGLEKAYFMTGDDGETVKALGELGKEKYDLDPDKYFDAPIDREALALLVFTSGTTGKGKGVMLSQKNILSDMTDVIQYIDFGRKTVGVLPPHHTYGSSVILLGHALIGAEVYISAGLKYVVKEFKAEKPEHLVLVPLYLETFYRKMQAGIKEKGKEKLVKIMMKLSGALRHIGIDLRKKLFSSLREALGGEVKMIITGGAPINAEIIAFFDAIGISTLNGYGITECAPIIAVNRSRNIVKGTVGQPLDIDTVKIDEPNEDGEGEILVKGDNVMLGYYKDEDATRDAFDGEGFFRTGDYGKITKEGAIAITGRKKNLIILSNGKNVYPEEIENEFVAVPGVIDVIVYEGQSRRGMEHNQVVLEIFPDKEFIEKNGIEDADKYFHKFVEDYNRTAVPYKKIGILKVRDEEFPKNTLRKILRFKLDMTID